MKKLTLMLFAFLSITNLFAQGKVYIVLGSDTSIWEGLDTKKQYHYYKHGLYSDPARNAYKVMDPAWRGTMTDSYGTPMKLTWWIMAGNTFRYSTNTNVPHANSVIFHLFNKYHGANASLLGDEISLHYHNFTWTDYDSDGVYYYNQALHWDDYKEDFEYTLSQLLIDEDIFPVSFRGGWHFMENDWQNYLEDVLPFSMHNNYPAKRTYSPEPINNLQDWSEAPSTWVPYHPAEDNYQVPGDLNGWELRSIYTKSTQATHLNEMFQNAQAGEDQVACIWSHLPENDFPEQLQRIDSLLHAVAQNYPDVKFQYCSAVEAMQEWMKTDDTLRPGISFNFDVSNNQLYFDLTTFEELFQKQPYFALKDVYERYTRLSGEQTGPSSWRYYTDIDINKVAKIAFAGTDIAGNLSTFNVLFKPEDHFVNAGDDFYSELHGLWSDAVTNGWNLDARITQLAPGDSAVAFFGLDVFTDAVCNLFIQLPPIENPTDSMKAVLTKNGEPILVKEFSEIPESDKWIYLGTSELLSQDNYYTYITAYNNSDELKNFGLDVVKHSALVRDKELVPEKSRLNFQLVSKYDTAYSTLTLNNNGIEQVTISSITSQYGLFKPVLNKNYTVDPMSSMNIPIEFYGEDLGNYEDTLTIVSDDPINPVQKVYCNAIVENPFALIDNEAESGYTEVGDWKTSVTQAYGETSRYAFLNGTPLASADYTVDVEYFGIYSIWSLLPKTENSSDKAVYTLFIDGEPETTIEFDQNWDSAEWRKLFTRVLPTDKPVTVRVEDTGLSSNGAVIRADALKFSLEMELTDIDNNSSIPTEYKLSQNYPNPFNPATTIAYQLPHNGHAELYIYDLLGRKVATLVNEVKQAGTYSVNFNASALSSGVYFYTLKAGKFAETKKMMLLK